MGPTRRLIAISHWPDPLIIVLYISGHIHTIYLYILYSIHNKASMITSTITRGCSTSTNIHNNYTASQDGEPASKMSSKGAAQKASRLAEGCWVRDGAQGKKMKDGRRWRERTHTIWGGVRHDEEPRTGRRGIAAAWGRIAACLPAVHFGELLC